MRDPSTLRLIERGEKTNHTLFYPIGDRTKIKLPKRKIVLQLESPLSYLCYPPLTTANKTRYWAYHFEPDIQGLPKNTIFTSPTAGTIISSVGKTSFYSFGSNETIGILFNSDLVNNLNEEFSWNYNALSNAHWWKGDIVANTKRFEQLMRLPSAKGIGLHATWDNLAHNNSLRQGNFSWNEVLFGATLKALVALFSPRDCLLSRFNLINYGNKFYHAFSNSIPLMIIDDHSTDKNKRRLYLEDDLLRDIKSLLTCLDTNSTQFNENEKQLILAFFSRVNSQCTTLDKVKELI